MQPHSNFGIRVRGCHIIGGSRGQSGGKHINSETLSLMSFIYNLGLSVMKVPFWRKLYRQGRRG